MDYTKRCRQISNSFYNLGLEKAQIRDLSGAAECLKKSLHFNKYQTDARNLLGLIYYEMGETAEALVQWVISSNLQPQKNRAVHYLHEIQDKPGRLEAESVNIKKYNQGLFHAQNGSDDLAILQLSRPIWCLRFCILRVKIIPGRGNLCIRCFRSIKTIPRPCGICPS